MTNSIIEKNLGVIPWVLDTIPETSPETVKGSLRAPESGSLRAPDHLEHHGIT